MILEVRHFTDTGHILPDTEFLCSKGCANLHGHTYAYIVRFRSEELKGGMVVDFKLIKQLLDEYDHKTLVCKQTHPQLCDFLYDMKPSQIVETNYIPSSENIATAIKQKIEAIYPHVNHIEVWVCEGYKGAERANWTIAS